MGHRCGGRAWRGGHQVSPPTQSADAGRALLLKLHPQARMTPAGLTHQGRSAVLDPFAAAGLAAGIPVAELVGDAQLWQACVSAYRQGLLVWQLAGIAHGMPIGPVRPRGWQRDHGHEVPAGVAGHQWLVEQVNAPSSSQGLSRFALLRVGPAGWVLESGRSDWVVELPDAGLHALAALKSHPKLATLLRLTALGSDGDNDAQAQAWYPHDRYFAQRARRDSAGLFPDRLVGAPLPARREQPPAGTRVGLPVPASPGLDEPTLWQAQAQRCSVRHFAATPVGLDNLGELLWRTLRVKHVRPRDPNDPTSYEAVFRPVASGGAMHANDLWLLCGAGAVTGLPPGAWWYDPFAHDLVAVPGTEPAVAEQLARLATGAGGPAMLGLLTVRHARTAWKYGPIAYALECKDIGVILDQLNLTCGALGLGFCAWGSGPTRAVCDLLGLDPEVEAPLGEFVLGLPALTQG